MAWAAVAAGALSIAGSLTSSLMGMDQAQVTRKFIRRMDNTKYQRSMRDMRRSGLNPMLAYQQGAQSTAAGPTAPIPDMGGAGARAVEAGTSAKEVSSKKSLRSGEEKVLAGQVALLKEQTIGAKVQAERQAVDRDLAFSDLTYKAERQKVDQTTGGLKLIRAGRMAELAAAPISSAVGAVSPWRRGAQPK